MRKNIPQTIRKQCWVKYVGKKYKGKCYVCNDTITPFYFEAGHIVPYDNTDENTNSIDNLRPVCSPCNKSVGKTNMNEFKKIYLSKFSIFTRIKNMFK